MGREPRVLIWDIETAPLLISAWREWDTSAVWREQDWYMLSFSYKWLGEKRIHHHSLNEYKGFKKNPTDDKRLVQDLWKLIDEADILVAHNGDRFDIKKANAKFLEHKLPVPSSYKTVDTYKVAKKYFALTSNKLNYLADLLGIGRKIQTGGAQLWRDCMAGDEKAWRKMNKYCDHDVRLLEKVYLELQKWHTSHPDLTLYTGERGNCKHCRSKKLQKRGFEYLKVKVYQRLFCLDCGSWQRGEEVKHKRK